MIGRVWENGVDLRLGSFSQRVNKQWKQQIAVEEVREKASQVCLCFSRLAELTQRWLQEEPLLAFCFCLLSFGPPPSFYFSLLVADVPIISLLCLHEIQAFSGPYLCTGFQSFHWSLFEYHLWNGNLSVKHETKKGWREEGVWWGPGFNYRKWNQIWAARREAWDQQPNHFLRSNMEHDGLEWGGVMGWKGGEEKPKEKV